MHPGSTAIDHESRSTAITHGPLADGARADGPRHRLTRTGSTITTLATIRLKGYIHPIE